MTGKEFLNSLANGKADILQQLLDTLTETGSDYCVIGGLAVNSYVEPVVSLDVDIVVAVNDIVTVANAARVQNVYCRARCGPTWMTPVAEARGKRTSLIFPESSRPIQN